MSLENIYYIGQTVAVLAILGSLAYVAFQTRQSIKVARAKAVWDAQHSYAEINEVMAMGGALSELSYKVYNDPSNLSAYEKYRVHRFMRGVFQRVEAQYVLFANGILDEEVWQLRRRYIHGLLSIPTIVDIWQAEKVNFIFTEAFVREIDSTRDTERTKFLGDAELSEPDSREPSDEP